MSLRPQPVGPVPQETARVARAAFPHGHAYLRLADELGALFTLLKMAWFRRRHLE